MIHSHITTTFGSKATNAPTDQHPRLLLRLVAESGCAYELVNSSDPTVIKAFNELGAKMVEGRKHLLLQIEELKTQRRALRWGSTTAGGDVAE